jgi:acetyl esterase/lipase
MKHCFNHQFMKNWTSFLLFGIFFSASVSAQKPNADAIERKWLDVPYAKASRAQKLDIYLPDDGNGPFPVIVSIHGGAFKSGDKGDNQLTPMLKGLKRGYAVVSINYRLIPEAIFCPLD